MWSLGWCVEMGLKTGLVRYLGSGRGLGILLFEDGVSGIEDTMVRVIWIIDVEIESGKLRRAIHIDRRAKTG